MYQGQSDGFQTGKADDQQQHRAVVVALLSAVPYGLAAVGMVVRPLAMPPQCLPSCTLLRHSAARHLCTRFCTHSCVVACRLALASHVEHQQAPCTAPQVNAQHAKARQERHWHTGGPLFMGAAAGAPTSHASSGLFMPQNVSITLLARVM